MQAIFMPNANFEYLRNFGDFESRQYSCQLQFFFAISGTNNIHVSYKFSCFLAILGTDNSSFMTILLTN